MSLLKLVRINLLVYGALIYGGLGAACYETVERFLFDTVRVRIPALDAALDVVRMTAIVFLAISTFAALVAGLTLIVPATAALASTCFLRAARRRTTNADRVLNRE